MKYMYTLKNLSVKSLFISSFLAFNSVAANATVYTYTFTTSDFVGQGTPSSGTLEGTITIDSTLILGDPNFDQSTSDVGISIPTWLTNASFTFTEVGNSGFPTVTKTLDPNTSTNGVAFDELFWRTTDGDFDFSQNIEDELTRLAFRSPDNVFAGFGFTGLGQQVYNEEFLLNGSTTSAVPGPLPFLGFATFAYYFRKFKKTSS